MSKKYKGIRICEHCDEAMLFFGQFVVRNNLCIVGIGVVQNVVESQ